MAFGADDVESAERDNLVVLDVGFGFELLVDVVDPVMNELSESAVLPLYH